MPSMWILWAIPTGKSDRLDERPMTSMPLTAEQANRAQEAATRDGWHSFRRVRETNKAPDFAAGVRCSVPCPSVRYRRNRAWLRGEITTQEHDEAGK